MAQRERHARETISSIQKQIAQQDEHAEDIRIRKARSVGAMLPGAYSEIHFYCLDCARYLHNIRKAALKDEEERKENPPDTEKPWRGDGIGGTVTASTAPVPEMPTRPYDIVRRFIEHANENHAKALTKLILALELQQRFFSDIVTECKSLKASPKHADMVCGYLDDGLIMTAEVITLIYALRQFSPEVDPGPLDPITGDDIISNLGTIAIFEDKFPEIFARLRNNFKAHSEQLMS
jgi:hypothetical protein